MTEMAELEERLMNFIKQYIFFFSEWKQMKDCDSHKFPSEQDADFSIYCILISFKFLFLVLSYIANYNSVALSPQADYTNWATATCQRNLVPNFVDRGVLRGQHGGPPTANYIPTK
jgi:hypothetical protein